MFDRGEPIVITGIGLITALGDSRERVWQSVQAGRTGIGLIRGVRGIKDDTVIGAMVDIPEPIPGELKSIRLARHAADEALVDADINWATIDRTRFGCALAGHMGDTSAISFDQPTFHPNGSDGISRLWYEQVLPNTACSVVANTYGLCGPRLSHSTACASGLISVLSACRSIRQGACDISLAGAGESIHPLFLAGFRSMRALAEHDEPAEACRPFDRNRRGFVMGEGAAVFVVERLSHALNRGARIYARIAAGRILSEAHHVTSLDAESDALAHLIGICLDQAKLHPSEIGYINAHGTGTLQNDQAEMRGIRQAMGASVRTVRVSASKSMIGHLVNAAGCTELAITALAMRDGFTPATLNLTDPDPECHFDALPLVGRRARFDHAMKLSIAFGGHLVGLILDRWNDLETGFAYPLDETTEVLDSRIPHRVNRLPDPVGV